ncbi:hypothetical protein AJ80_09179 [Polytolypa hystricis UAMH7299]|uniref:Uncharacterized protein n=1 Tax=Polytolypa hystricis (strain UAMH7299) TaxID=1447883 RepID=A0A2B7WVL2_POLH7|nr:hypothetical protein AJ80_09179 [Polytolypa hystricis UAMH7299]
MDVFYSYTYGTAAWLTLQAMPLIAMPKVIITMLLEETRPSSPLEIFFARSYGLSLLALSLVTIVLTGSIPLTSSYTMSPEPTDAKAPYAVPTILATSFFHGTSAFYMYMWYVGTGQMLYAVGMVAYAGLGSVGLWCLLFASEKGRISRRTGADKRMTGFPFGNKEADRKREGRRKGI